MRPRGMSSNDRGLDLPQYDHKIQDTHRFVRRVWGTGWLQALSCVTSVSGLDVQGAGASRSSDVRPISFCRYHMLLSLVREQIAPQNLGGTVLRTDAS